jgi:hypothetical protein
VVLTVESTSDVILPLRAAVLVSERSWTTGSSGISYLSAVFWRSRLSYTTSPTLRWSSIRVRAWAPPRATFLLKRWSSGRSSVRTTDHVYVETNRCRAMVCSRTGRVDLLYLNPSVYVCVVRFYVIRRIFPYPSSNSKCALMRGTCSGKTTKWDFHVFLCYHFRIIQWHNRIHHDGKTFIIFHNIRAILYIFEEEIYSTVPVCVSLTVPWCCFFCYACRGSPTAERTPIQPHLSIYDSTNLLLDFGHFINFLIFDIVGRTRKGDQPRSKAATCTQDITTQKHTDIHTSSWIRTHDPSVWMAKTVHALDRGHCDRHTTSSLFVFSSSAPIIACSSSGDNSSSSSLCSNTCTKLRITKRLEQKYCLAKRMMSTDLSGANVLRRKSQHT